MMLLPTFRLLGLAFKNISLLVVNKCFTFRLICCLFQPANGCSALFSLVEIICFCITITKDKLVSLWISNSARFDTPLLLQFNGGFSIFFYVCDEKY